MSSPGRTKGARSLKSTKFDNSIVGVSLGDRNAEARVQKIITLREENVEEKYEVSTNVPQRGMYASRRPPPPAT